MLDDKTTTKELLRNFLAGAAVLGVVLLGAMIFMMVVIK
jgi:hypothetical protein